MWKSAHCKDRDKTVLGIISNKRNNFQSIYVGQANFEQDYVRRMLLNFVNCTRPCMSNLGLKTCKFKLLTQGSRLPLLAVNYENGLFSICAHTRETVLIIKDRWQEADILRWFNRAFALKRYTPWRLQTNKE